MCQYAMSGIYVGACAGSGHMGTFGNWVKLKRKERGITLKELDTLTGVSYGAISDWERGRRTPHRDTAAQIATALGADPREALEALIADTPGLSESCITERVGRGPLSEQELRVIRILSLMPDAERDAWVMVGESMVQQSTNSEAE